MRYEFKCPNCLIMFEIEQSISSKHEAVCPKCGLPAQRVYSRLQWIWADSLFRPDGNLRQQDDYAPLKG